MRRSRRPVWAVSSIEGSNPSLSADFASSTVNVGRLAASSWAAAVPRVAEGPTSLAIRGLLGFLSGCRSHRRSRGPAASASRPCVRPPSELCVSRGQSATRRSTKRGVVVRHARRCERRAIVSTGSGSDPAALATDPRASRVVARRVLDLRERRASSAAGCCCRLHRRRPKANAGSGVACAGDA